MATEMCSGAISRPGTARISMQDIVAALPLSSPLPQPWQFFIGICILKIQGSDIKEEIMRRKKMTESAVRSHRLLSKANEMDFYYPVCSICDSASVLACYKCHKSGGRIISA